MAGGLTPFIGAGMSMRDRGGGLAGWKELVCGLEAAAAFPAAHGVLGDELVVRADRAATRLRVEGRLPAAIREHLGTLESIDDVPQQTMALAGLRCPLVISTNYDDVYLAAAVQQSRKNRQESPRHDRQEPSGDDQEEPSGDDQEAPIVVGRGAADCRRVLRSLRTPDHPMIWAIQGFLGGQVKGRVGEATRGELEGQLVVGHAEYRRVTNAEPYFRRSFAEVFRSRTFLFLGSSVERYLLDLFSEIIELYGPSPDPHFAVFCEEAASQRPWREEMARTHGIYPIFLETCDEVKDFLREIPVRQRHVSVAVTIPPGRDIDDNAAPSESPAAAVHVEGSRLPVTEVKEHEWYVISLGGRRNKPQNVRAGKDLGWDDRYLPATWRRCAQEGRDELFPLYMEDERRSESERCSPTGIVGVYVRASPRLPSSARLRPTRLPPPQDNPAYNRVKYARDLRLIAPAVAKLMRVAAPLGVMHMHSELLAGGSRRTFPAAYSLVQMIRGWADWTHHYRPTGKSAPPRLTIHLDPDVPSERDVLRELDSRRISLEQLLDTELVNLWIDAPVGGGDYIRTPIAHKPTATVWSVVDQVFPLRREDTEWTLTVEPAPCLGWTPWPVRELREWEKQQKADMDLQTFGVAPYSVLRIIPP